MKTQVHVIGLLAALSGCTALGGLLGAPGPGPAGVQDSAAQVADLRGQAMFPAAVVKGRSSQALAQSLSQVPVEGATVKILRAADGKELATATTDASGNFVVPKLPVDQAVKIEISYTADGTTYTVQGLARADSAPVTVDAASTAAILLAQSTGGGGTLASLNLAKLAELASALAAAMTDEQAKAMVDAPTAQTLTDTFNALKQADPSLESKLQAAAGSAAPAPQPTAAGGHGAAVPTPPPTATRVSTLELSPPLDSPYSVAVSGGGTLIAPNSLGYNVVRVDGTTVTVIAGAGRPGQADGPAMEATFQVTAGIAEDSRGNIFVTESTLHRIRKIAAADHSVSLLAGAFPSGVQDGVGAAAKFNAPGGLVADPSDSLYVADSYNHKIRKVTPAGEVTTFAGTGAGGMQDGAALSATFKVPTDVALNSDLDLYVADSANKAIRKITPQGDVSTLVSGSMGKPHGLCVTPQGYVYVADFDLHVIWQVSPAGALSAFAGKPGVSGNADGPGADARFDTPSDVAVDDDGVLWVVDRGNGRIRKIQP